LYSFIVKDDYALNANSWIRITGGRAEIYPLNTKHAWIGPIFYLDYENGRWLFNGEGSSFND